MTRNNNNFLWGLLFIVLGIGFAGNAFDLWHFSIFFPGWWTLFLIIPCGISIIQNGFQTGSIIGFVSGVMLLLSCQGFVSTRLIGQLIIPVILIIAGLGIIFSNSSKKTISIKSSDFQKKNSEHLTDYTATFSSQSISLDNQIFTGASINAIFGSVTLRLDNAIINEDVVINSNATFGGIEIYLPAYVNVKVSSTPIFGGVTNRRHGIVNSDAPTVYINATCMFGGVEIR
ncbi:LiaF transmembrane domain-containing protein [Velocimicrobium porci]|uniref:Uncharacterized protein n=1 Tax=Velocimicrobium porci TaxID=2606634 RepID=A0A6L5XXI5_9FIRM|nr:LiaF domain-containing protein [Velocimicrobium porci]MSS63257.1 hypothetical protein [Velocimicrobium porci]